MSAPFPQACTVLKFAQRFGGVLERGSADAILSGLAALDRAGPGDASFLAQRSMAGTAARTRAGAVLVSEALKSCLAASAALIVVPDPYATYAAVARWIDEDRSSRLAPAPGVHPSAIVDALAKLDPQASVGPNCSVGAGSRIEAGVVLGAGCVLGRDVHLGADTRLAARVTLYDGVRIGARCLVHSGTVIGADGFGFAPNEGRWSKIPQLGSVVIGDDVEIGANCAIDRGALDDTVIGEGCKLDNLIQVGHNVQIGEHTAIAGCVGIAGSAVIGRRCRIGGKAGILGHLSICDDVTISAMSLVMSSIEQPGFYSGIFPLMDNASWERAAAVLRRLPQLRQHVRQLEKLTGHLR
jgi:UDP-3-O-[3-hydroxymyristoyl] glucosamine N-acyltransferase